MILELPRRKFLIGLASLIAAPAVVRASSLMPVKALIKPPIVLNRIDNSYLSIEEITREAVKLFNQSNEFLKDYNFYQGEQWNLNDIHS